MGDYQNQFVTFNCLSLHLSVYIFNICDPIKRKWVGCQEYRFPDTANIERSSLLYLAM